MDIKDKLAQDIFAEHSALDQYIHLEDDVKAAYSTNERVRLLSDLRQKVRELRAMPLEANGKQPSAFVQKLGSQTDDIEKQINILLRANLVLDPNWSFGQRHPVNKVLPKNITWDHVLGWAIGLVVLSLFAWFVTAIFFR